MALPAPVERYLERALGERAPTPQRVRLGQVGKMWQKPGARSRGFVAEEELAVAEISFRWRARFPIVPFGSLQVLDRYEAGEGSLEGRLFGRIRIFRLAGPELDAGEAVRYLAELPWAPHAMASNPRLDWREVDGRTVEVSAEVGLRRPAVRFDFDESGDIVGASCEARPRTVGKRIEPTPWSGSFDAYEVVGGLRIPRHAEVRWELPDGPFTYWEGTITSLDLEP